MAVVITEREAAGVSYEQIVNLIHESFRERTKQGLLYSCAEISVEDFINKTRNGIVMVAIDDDSNVLLGTGTLQVFRNKRSSYGYDEFDAIAEHYKGRGIGSLLVEARTQKAKKLGLQYILSDTAAKAKSAVNYHKKNGFKIIGYVSYRSTNYYSYVFRKQLEPSYLWNNQLWLSFLFVCSFIFCRLTHRKDGKLTFVGSTLKYLSQLCKR